MKCEKASATVLANDGQSPQELAQSKPKGLHYQSVFDFQE